MAVNGQSAVRNRCVRLGQTLVYFRALRPSAYAGRTNSAAPRLCTVRIGLTRGLAVKHTKALGEFERRPTPYASGMEWM